MKKLIGLSFLALGLFVCSNADAASSRGAKPSVAINYSTVISTVVANGAGAVYSVILGTGAAGAYLALFDSATGLGVLPTGNTSLKSRVYFSSTTQSTVVQFDPPLQFNSGIQAALSAATDQALIVFERGRIISGN